MAEPRIQMTEEEIEKQLTQGCDFINGQDYASAVDFFAKLLEELVQQYGEFHQLLGKVYMNYGHALLGYARDESDVVNVKLNENDEKTEKEDKKQPIEIQQSNGKKENEEIEKKNEKEKSNEIDTSESENKPNDGEDGDDEDEEDDDEIDNLQLAWEILEVSKKIFSQNDDQKSKELLVETLYLLGDVSMESENCQLAISDLVQCAKLQKEIDGTCLRRLADIEFRIALAESMNGQYNESINHLRAATDLLKERKQLLEKQKNERSTEQIDEKSTETNLSKKTDQDEIKEIEELLKEIENKITDIEDYKTETSNQVKQFLKDLIGSGSSSDLNNEVGTSFEGPSTSKSSLEAIKSPAKVAEKVEKLNINGHSESEIKNSPSKNAAVNDISHLVRRKRSSDDKPDHEHSAKKPSK